jgi:hypothetical protein
MGAMGGFAKVFYPDQRCEQWSPAQIRNMMPGALTRYHSREAVAVFTQRWKDHQAEWQAKLTESARHPA